MRQTLIWTGLLLIGLVGCGVVQILAGAEGRAQVFWAVFCGSGVIVAAAALWWRFLAGTSSEQATDDLYRDIVEGAGEVLCRVDGSGRFSYLNTAWTRTTGYAIEESCGRPVLEFVYPDDQVFSRMLLDSLNHGEPLVHGELRLLTRDESYRWVELVARGVHDGRRLQGWTGTIRNVTAKRLAEEALRENEERYRRIFQNIQDVYFEISLGGTIVEISPSVEQVSGYRRDQLIGRNFEVLSRDPEDLKKIREEIVHLQALKDCELVLRSEAGEEVPCSANARLMIDGNGKPLKIIGSLRDISERRRAENEIRKLAYHDTLTGLPNRSLFLDRLHQALAHAQRANHLLAILFLDLDRFKDVNDTLGHARGDLLLQHVATRLSENVRRCDTVARLGGDEFVVLLTAVKSDRDVSVVAEKILEDLSRSVDLDGQQVFTGCSIGVVLYPHDGADAQTLLKHADMAMYAAKDRGRNTYQFFSEEMNRKAIDRHQLEIKLRHALERNELSLYYQPQWDMRARKLVGVEALLRWETEADGMISPGRFIPVAEETGLIRPIGEWVLKTACAQNRQWQEAGLPHLRVAVNISARQFRQPDLVSMVDRILAETRLDAQYLELELTESYLMEDAQAANRTLEFLKVRGIQLAIDDFGTGYSSLNYLKNFPIDRIKIDQSFVRDVTNNRDDAAIVETIIAMAQSLELDVIAEGVEGADQLQFLSGHNCYEMQGYFFARPMPADEMTLYLADCQARQRRLPHIRNYPLEDELGYVAGGAGRLV